MQIRILNIWIIFFLSVWVFVLRVFEKNTLLKQVYIVLTVFKIVCLPSRDYTLQIRFQTIIIITLARLLIVCYFVSYVRNFHRWIHNNVFIDFEPSSMKGHDDFCLFIQTQCVFLIVTSLLSKSGKKNAVEKITLDEPWFLYTFFCCVSYVSYCRPGDEVALFCYYWRKRNANDFTVQKVRDHCLIRFDSHLTARSHIS